MAIRRLIAVVEGQIDRLVYRMYELMDEQIRIIEETSAAAVANEPDELDERTASEQ